MSKRKPSRPNRAARRAADTAVRKALRQTSKARGPMTDALVDALRDLKGWPDLPHADACRILATDDDVARSVIDHANKLGKLDGNFEEAGAS